MLSLTTYEHSPGDVEVFGTTNKFFQFALDQMGKTYANVSQAELSRWLDNLLPVALRDMEYLPAISMMKQFSLLFFSHTSRRGLIPSLAVWNSRRQYDPTIGDWLTGGDSRIAGTFDTMHTSYIGMLHRMSEFLSWFPQDQALVAQCQAWADVFSEVNHEKHMYGHRVSANSWGLYNFVHTGPTHGTPPDTPDPALRLLFEMEGFPDSSWVIGLEYGALAEAFLRLSQATSEVKYRDLAMYLNEGLWKSRLNHRTYLMPDTVTPHGPLPGDFHPITGKYSHDTDCLYWVRKLYSAYALAGQPLRQYQPSAKPITSREVKKEARNRRREVGGLLKGSLSERILGMALGVTLDWIIYGWIPKGRQFGRKIFHDGKLAEQRLYGDGKYNTLYMLLEAFRWTQDQFFLDVYEHAMQRYEALAATSQLGGLFPTELLNGILPNGPFTPYGTKRTASSDPPYVYDESQDIFLDIAVTAHQVTNGVFRAQGTSYLNRATKLGENLLKAHTNGLEAIYGGYHGIVGKAYLHLALAPKTLMRIRMVLPDSNVSLVIHSLSNTGDLTISVLGNKATIYMDKGQYEISWVRSDGTQSAIRQLNVTKDDQVNL